MEDFPINVQGTDCGGCVFYYMIDSGYGWCTRYPPKNIQVKTFWKTTFAFTYPEVPWCCAGCGEYKEKK
jgi:hypothetical protein